jgi:hypothetical protein
MKPKRTYTVKTKVLYQDNYKDYDHYQDTILRWCEKGWYIENETASSKDEECYTLLCYDGYNH